MTTLRHIFSLPLLVKELTERAARKRTYVVRVVYGALLYVPLLLMLGSQMRRGGGWNLLGQGDELFEALMWSQFTGIALFLPAMMCGLITQEKERDSLTLLLLTDLPPWQILLQKYLGGLVPMLSFLLLGLPPLAVAYSLGGVEPEQIALGFYALVLACLQVGAIALFCSVWFRTTVGAFIGTYLLAAAFYGGPILIVSSLEELQWIGRINEEKFLVAFPPYVWAEMFPEAGAVGTVYPASGGAFFNRNPVLPVVALGSLGPLLSTLVFLVLARVFFLRRAFRAGANPLLRVFRWLDARMHAINSRLGGVVFGRRSHSLPGDEPIAWREARQKALGRPNHLVRVWLLVQIPVAVIVLLVVSQNYADFAGDGKCDELTAVPAILGSLMVLVIGVHSANAFVSERVQQTLEVLLTTPLTAAEIVRQKARVIGRLWRVLAIPLLSVFLVEFIAKALAHHGGGWSFLVPAREAPDGSYRYYYTAPGFYITGQLISVLVYLPLASWLGLWIGLKFRTRFKAILITVGVLVAWTLLPVFVGVFGHLGSNWWSQENARYIYAFSPATFPFFNEIHELRELPFRPWVALVVNFAIYGSSLHWLRRRCLTRADRYLRRG